MRIGVRSTARDLTLTGRFRRRLRKKEKKKIDKVRAGFSLNPSRGRDAPVSSAPVSSAPFAAGARHDRVPQMQSVELQQLGFVPVRKSTRLSGALRRVAAPLDRPLTRARSSRSRAGPAAVARASHDPLLAHRQGRLSGEAQARGRGRRVDGADPAHRARGVAARPLVLSRQRGAARYAYAAGPRRAAVGPQSLPRQRLFDA